MSIPGFYSLASPTDKLIDDNSLIEKIFNHIDNKTTDLGDIVWQEPVSNYLDLIGLKKKLILLEALLFLSVLQLLCHLQDHLLQEQQL